MRLKFKFKECQKTVDTKNPILITDFVFHDILYCTSVLLLILSEDLKSELSCFLVSTSAAKLLFFSKILSRDF